MIRNLLKKWVKNFCQITGLPIYFLKNILFEMRMLWVRIYSVLPIQRFKVKNIKKRERINLNFGCGQTWYKNWIGIDSFFGEKVDLVLDLRRHLPFEKNSVDYCYSEHFLEHLYPEEGFFHLEEVYRILKEGGRYRVVVPDAIRFAKKHIEGEDSFFQLAFPWTERSIDALYHIVNWRGEHKNIFDFEHVEYLGKQIGFSVKQSAANASDVAELRIDKSYPQRVAESLYVEFIKAEKF